MVNPSKNIGQLTFRCDDKTYQELIEVALHLGTDRNGLLNMLVREALPAFLERAAQVERRYRQARADLDGFAIPTSDPALRLVILEALRVPAEQRERVLAEAVRRSSRPGDPAVADTVLYAQRLIAKGEALEGLRQLTAGAGNWRFDHDELVLIGQLRDRLNDDVAELQRQYEEARRPPEEPGDDEQARRSPKKARPRPGQRNPERDRGS